MLPRIKISKRLSLPQDRAILLICMGISLVFWLLVKLSGRYSASREVALKVELPENRAFRNGQPPPISVDVEGTGWDLLIGYFSGSDTLVYNMDEADEGQMDANKLRTAINSRFSSSDLQVENIYDTNLDLTLEETLSRQLPIRLVDSMKFHPGYKLIPPVQLRPDSVIVVGPTSQVKDLKEWPTKPLRLDNLMTSSEKDVELKAPPQSLRLGTRKVKALISVEQMTEESLFVGLEVINDPGTDSLRFFPQLIKVKYVVGLSQYASVDSSMFRLVADLNNTEVVNDRNTVPVTLAEQPDFVHNVTFSPKLAQYFVVKPDSVAVARE